MFYYTVYTLQSSNYIYYSCYKIIKYNGKALIPSQIPNKMKKRGEHKYESSYHIFHYNPSKFEIDFIINKLFVMQILKKELIC